MNRWPVPEVRASSFCVTPRPLRVSRTSLPMSRGVYFKSLTPFNKVTVREYYGVFLTRVNIVLPYGNISYHKPSRRLECSRTGTKHVPTRPAPTTKKLEALNYPVGMTRLDLILKITSADGKRKHEHRTVEIPDHPDALYRVFHVLRAWHRLWTECRLSGHNLLA